MSIPPPFISTTYGCGKESSAEKKRTAPELQFHNLTYSATTARGEKKILNNVSGRAIPGRLLAIMGRSGAGKSTLLDVLASRHIKDKLEGHVNALEQGGLPSRQQHTSCYVTQNEVLLSTATVREALMTSAQLRLPYHMADTAKAGLVVEIIEELGLQHCADTLIGEGGQAGTGISGGERRRTSIGLELITDPSLVLLDEPTSGLDSDTAMSTVLILQQLSRRNRTVIFTIHQPSSDMLDLFDDLLLLAEGRLAYHGPLSLATSFIGQAGFTCPTFRCPTDFFMALFKDDSIAWAICDAWTRYTDEHNTLTYAPEDSAGADSTRADSDGAGPDVHRRCPARDSLQLLKPWLRTEKEDVELLEARQVAKIQSVTTNPLWETTSASHVQAHFPPPTLRHPTCVGGRTPTLGPSWPERPPMCAPCAPRVHALFLTPSHQRPPYVREQPSAAGSSWPGRPPMWYQTLVLVKRFARTHYRSPALMTSEVSQYLFLAVNLGLMYFSLTDRIDKNAVHMRASSLWFTLATLALAPPGVAATAWNLERAVLRHEQAAKAYHPAAFYAAKTLTTWPIEIVQTSAFCAIVYFMIGLRASPSAFFIFLSTAVLCQLISETLGVLCASITKNSMYAIMVATIILIYMLAFNGFLLPETPVYFIWLKKISYLDFAYSTVITNEFSGLELRDAHGTVVHGEEVIPSFGQNGLSIGSNFVIITCILLGARAIGYLQLLCALRWKWL